MVDSETRQKLSVRISSKDPARNKCVETRAYFKSLCQILFKNFIPSISSILHASSSERTQNLIMSELKLTIRSSNADKTEVVADPSISVGEFKRLISEKVSVTPELQRLIYKGRVLKDDCTLQFYGINEEGQTIHLVKSGGTSASTTDSNTTSTPVSAPIPSITNSSATNQMLNPLSGFGGSGFGGLGNMGNMGGMGNMAGMQEELMRNPQMMQQMMNSPLMDSLMSDPEMMRNMIVNNPQLQGMLDSNPQIRHILNDPSVSERSLFFL